VKRLACILAVGVLLALALVAWAVMVAG